MATKNYSVSFTGKCRLNTNTMEVTINLQETYTLGNSTSTVKITSISCDYTKNESTGSAIVDAYLRTTGGSSSWYGGTWITLNGTKVVDLGTSNLCYLPYSSMVNFGNNCTATLLNSNGTTYTSDSVSVTHDSDGKANLEVSLYCSWGTKASGTHPRDTRGGINGGGSNIGATQTIALVDTSLDWIVGQTTTYTNLSTQASMQTTLSTRQIHRIALTFAKSGPAKFQSTGSYDTRGWLSTSSGFNSDTGIPSTYVKTDDDSGTGTNFLFTYNVTAGTQYYLFSRFYSASSSGTYNTIVHAPVELVLNKGTGISSVSGADIYTYKDYAEITCTLIDGYKFKGWYSDSSGSTLVSSEQTTSILLNKSKTTLYAIAELDTVRINVIAGDNVSVVAIGNEVSNTSVVVTATIGSTIAVGATLRDYINNEVITFDGWYDSSGNLISKNNPYTFTVSKAITLTAKAAVTEVNYNLTTSLDNNVLLIIRQDGEIIIDTDWGTDGIFSLPYRAMISCEPQLRTGYELKSFSGFGTFTPQQLISNVTVTATTREKPKKEYIPIINSKPYIPIINEEEYLPQIK